MPYPCTDDPNEILEYVVAAKSNAQKFNTFVNGSSTQTVQLGTGDPTPVLRKFIADAQSVVATAANDAAETVLDTVADMKLNKADKAVPAESGNLAKLDETGGIHDSGRAAEDFVLLLAYANDEAMELAWQNRVNIDRYNHWHARGIEQIAEAGLFSGQVKRVVCGMITARDESIAQHRLQLRLMNGTNPDASAKPVLFVIAGQSNAQGACDLGTNESAADIGQFWAWNESPPYFKPLKDPVYHSSGSGGAWPAFARRVFALTGRKVLILNVAFGGSAVTDGGYTTANTWADNGYGTCRAQAKNAYDAMKSYCAAHSIEYDFGGMLWIQGEAEIARLVAGTITLQDYKDGTEDVFGWFRTEFDSLPDLKIFVSEIGSSSSWENNPNYAAYKNYVRQIRQALREVVADDEKTGIAYSLALEFVKCGYVSNNTIHYSQEGYNLVGDAFARYAVHECNL